MIGTAELNRSQKTASAARRMRTVLVACMIANLGLFLAAAVASLPFPYGLNYGEGPLIDQAERIAGHEPLYKADLDQPPYVIANYPPVYPSVIALVRTLTGWPLLQIGRAISLLAALACGWVIGALAYRLTASRLSGWLAATLFLANSFIVLWVSFARVDFLALALSLVALWLIYRRWDSWFWLGVAVISMLAAILTRHTYALAVPMASAVWLWHRDRRRALLFLVTLVTAGLALFVILNALTQGGLYTNIVVANANAYLPARTLVSLALLLCLWPVVVALAGAEIAQTLRQPGSTPEQDSLRYGLLPYTLGAFLASLAVGKVGSDTNYLLELAVALAIWAAIAVVRQARRRTIRQQSILLLVVVQLVWVFVVSLALRSAIAMNWRDLNEYDRLFQQVEAAATEGPVLAGEHLEMVVLAGQRIYLQPFEYHQLHRAGLWDPTDLVREIRAQRFPLILLDESGRGRYEERWPEPVAAAIEKCYVPSAQPPGSGQGPGLVVFRPGAGCE